MTDEEWRKSIDEIARNAVRKACAGSAALWDLSEGKTERAAGLNEDLNTNVHAPSEPSQALGSKIEGLSEQYQALYAKLEGLSQQHQALDSKLDLMAEDLKANRHRIGAHFGLLGTVGPGRWSALPGRGTDGTVDGGPRKAPRHTGTVRPGSTKPGYAPETNA